MYIQVCEEYKLHRETYYLSVDMYDRFMDTQSGIQKEQLQLIGVTCLFIASKIEVGRALSNLFRRCMLALQSCMWNPLSTQTYKLVCIVSTHVFIMPNEVDINDFMTLVLPPPYPLSPSPSFSLSSTSLSLSSLSHLFILGNLSTKGVRICLRYRRCVHCLQHSRHWAHHL